MILIGVFFIIFLAILSVLIRLTLVDFLISFSQIVFLIIFSLLFYAEQQYLSSLIVGLVLLSICVLFIVFYGLVVGVLFSKYSHALNIDDLNDFGR